MLNRNPVSNSWIAPGFNNTSFGVIRLKPAEPSVAFKGVVSTLYRLRKSKKTGESFSSVIDWISSRVLLFLVQVRFFQSMDGLVSVADVTIVFQEYSRQ